MLIASEYALAELASLVGESAGGTARGPDSHRERAERLTAALVQRLWDADAGQFLSRDLHDGQLVRERSAAGLLPLLVPGLPRRLVDSLLRTASGEHFGLGNTVAVPPSYDLRGPAFDRCRYWRGPAWFNVAWLLERGLRVHGERTRADALRTAALDAAAGSRFAEYVDPYTGEGRGTRDFSWTAALALDLLASAGGAGDVGAEAEGRDAQRMPRTPMGEHT